MKPRLYLETTIPSYLTAWPSRDLVRAAHQQLTKEWWATRRADFEILVSPFVLDEAAAGDPAAASERLKVLRDFPVLEITRSAESLAAALIGAGIIPSKAAGDASHIAVSAVHGIDYMLTWNCTHLANAEIKRMVDGVCRDAGFICPVICTPEELMGTPK